MIGQAVFIWSSYAVAVVALAGLVISSLVDRRRVRRDIAERGLERPREQRINRGLR